MKKKWYKYFYWLLLGVIVLVYSCREEIISPNNNSGNVNEPYKSSKRNSYTFVLNAENISQSVIDYPDISYSSSRVFISVADHASGSVEIIVLTNSRDILYRSVVNEDNEGLYGTVQGIRPAIIEINLNNFTGKLRFQLTGLL